MHIGKLCNFSGQRQRYWFGQLHYQAFGPTVQSMSAHRCKSAKVKCRQWVIAHFALGFSVKINIYLFQKYRITNNELLSLNTFNLKQKFALFGTINLSSLLSKVTMVIFLLTWLSFWQNIHVFRENNDRLIF